jgi:hypothetical protein
MGIPFCWRWRGARQGLPEEVWEIKRKTGRTWEVWLGDFGLDRSAIESLQGIRSVEGGSFLVHKLDAPKWAARPAFQALGESSTHHAASSLFCPGSSRARRPGRA